MANQTKVFMDPEVVTGSPLELALRRDSHGPVYPLPPSPYGDDDTWRGYPPLWGMGTPEERRQMDIERRDRPIESVEGPGSLVVGLSPLVPALTRPIAKNIATTARAIGSKKAMLTPVNPTSAGPQTVAGPPVKAMEYEPLRIALNGGGSGIGRTTSAAIPPVSRWNGVSPGPHSSDIAKIDALVAKQDRISLLDSLRAKEIEKNMAARLAKEDADNMAARLAKEDAERRVRIAARRAKNEKEYQKHREDNNAKHRDEIRKIEDNNADARLRWEREDKSRKYDLDMKSAESDERIRLINSMIHRWPSGWND